MKHALFTVLFLLGLCMIIIIQMVMCGVMKLVHCPGEYTTKVHILSRSSWFSLCLLLQK